MNTGVASGHEVLFSPLELWLSLRLLCVLCASAVDTSSNPFRRDAECAEEAQSTPRHPKILIRQFLGGLTYNDGP
jgi:hypothetical protein